MSIISVAVKHLIAAGVTGDDLIAAISEMEACIETRSKGAIRQARYRENKASQNVTSVTGDDLPSQGSNGFPHPSLTPNSPIKENPPKGGQKKVSQSRKTRLLENWELPQEWGDWAETQGLSGEEIIHQAEKFRDRQRSLGASYIDWEATWRNWIRNHIEWNSKNVQAKTKTY